MALQSQMMRGNSIPRSSDSYNRTRRSEQKRLVGYLLMTLIIISFLIYVFQSRPKAVVAEPKIDGASLTAAPSPAPTTDAPLQPPAPHAATTQVAPAPQRPVPEFTMAGKRPSSDGAPMGQATPISTPAPSASSPGSPAKLPPTAGQSPAPTPPAATPTSTPPSTPPVVKDPLLNPPAPGTYADSPMPPPLPGSPAAGSSAVSGDVAAAIAQAAALTAQQKPLEARTLLNRTLLDPRTPDSARQTLRDKLQELNLTLVFSPALFPGDPMSESYNVASGDSLVKIARKQQLVTESTLIARINHMANANSLRVGQQLKLVRGPFHAVVHKSLFRIDIFAGPTPSASALAASAEGSAGTLPENAESGWVYIRSFPVGLGEKGGTPLGTFMVKENSKLVNPFWVNPRTGQKFDADDPKNPIGERWVGLEGVDVKSKAYQGYGIHGTIDPTSIGKEMSMGCVRMQAEDVEIVYELLMPKVSVVKIVE